MHVHYVYRASLVRMPSTYLDDQAFLSCGLIASDLFSYYHDSGCLLSDICWCISDIFLRMLLQSVLPTSYLLVSISLFDFCSICLYVNYMRRYSNTPTSRLMALLCLMRCSFSFCNSATIHQIHTPMVA